MDFSTVGLSHQDFSRGTNLVKSSEFRLHQDLEIARKHRAAFRHDEDGHVGQKVDLVEAEVVADLLPAAEMNEICQLG